MAASRRAWLHPGCCPRPGPAPVRALPLPPDVAAGSREPFPPAPRPLLPPPPPPSPQLSRKPGAAERQGGRAPPRAASPHWPRAALGMLSRQGRLGARSRKPGRSGCEEPGRGGRWSPSPAVSGRTGGGGPSSRGPRGSGAVVARGLDVQSSGRGFSAWVWGRRDGSGGGGGARGGGDRAAAGAGSGTGVKVVAAAPAQAPARRAGSERAARP